MKILITGATSGIAYQVATSLLQKNHIVYLATHTKKEQEELEKKLIKEKYLATCLTLDVTKENDRKKIENLDFDCLISHAGVGMSGSIVDIDLCSLKEVYDVNIFGNFALVQEAYHKMQRQNKKGKIFITSSLAGMLPFPYLSCYTSSKAAISMIAFSLKKELEAKNSSISLSLIEPGAYHTGFNQAMIDREGKMLVEKNDQQVPKRLLRNLFILIEKRNTKSIVKKIVKEVEKETPKFKIRAPLFQVFVTKLYLVLFR